MPTRKVTVDNGNASSNTNDPQSPRAEVTKVGNLVKDPELRYTTKGIALCEVDLAVNPRPNEEKETEFYRLLIFGPLGENVAESNLEKSTRVIVVGSPDIESLVGEDGLPLLDETGKQRVRKKIFVNAIGPDLRYAKLDGITKIHRSNPKPPVELENF